MEKYNEKIEKLNEKLNERNIKLYLYERKNILASYRLEIVKNNKTIYVNFIENESSLFNFLNGIERTIYALAY